MKNIEQNGQTTPDQQTFSLINDVYDGMVGCKGGNAKTRWLRPWEDGKAPCSYVIRTLEDIVFPVIDGHHKWFIYCTCNRE